MPIIVPTIKPQRGNYFQIAHTREAPGTDAYPWVVRGLEGRFITGHSSLESAMDLYPNAAIDAASLQQWRGRLESKLSRRRLV